MGVKVSIVRSLKTVKDLMLMPHSCNLMKMGRATNQRNKTESPARKKAMDGSELTDEEKAQKILCKQFKDEIKAAKDAGADNVDELIAAAELEGCSKPPKDGQGSDADAAFVQLNGDNEEDKPNKPELADEQKAALEDMTREEKKEFFNSLGFERENGS